MKIKDEELNAYLDGELSGERADTVEKMLVSDPETADRLAQLAAVDDLLRGAVKQLSGKTDQAEALPRNPDLAQGAGQVKAPPIAANDNWWKLPLTASVALVVGLVAGNTLFASQEGGQDFAQIAQFDAGSGIGSFLETAQSGEVQNVGSAKGEVRFTFIGAAGNPCREFVIENSGTATQAVACRGQDGNWNTQLAAPASVGITADASDYQTASSEDEAFGQAVSALMQSDALEADSEAEFINRGWQD